MIKKIVHLLYEYNKFEIAYEILIVKSILIVFLLFVELLLPYSYILIFLCRFSRALDQAERSAAIIPFCTYENCVEHQVPLVFPHEVSKVSSISDLRDVTLVNLRRIQKIKVHICAFVYYVR